MMRISATLLEKFRRWLAVSEIVEHSPEKILEGEQCYCSDCEERRLIDYIRGNYTDSPALRLGRAYHSLVRYPQRNLFIPYYEKNEFKFDLAAIDQMLGRIDPRGGFEVPCTKDIVVRGKFSTVTLVAKCDHLVGRHIDEFKTSHRSFDVDRYAPSMQWRTMALLFDASSIAYRIVRLEEDEGIWRLKEPIADFVVYAYPNLERDVMACVVEFMNYLRLRGLESFLVPKGPVAVTL